MDIVIHILFAKDVGFENTSWYKEEGVTNRYKNEKSELYQYIHLILESIILHRRVTHYSIYNNKYITETVFLEIGR